MDARPEKERLRRELSGSGEALTMGFVESPPGFELMKKLWHEVIVTGYRAKS